MSWQAVFPVCFYAEVQKERIAGHVLGSGSREDRLSGVFSFLFLLGWVGIRETIMVLWFPGMMGAGEGYRGK